MTKAEWILTFFHFFLCQFVVERLTVFLFVFFSLIHFLCWIKKWGVCMRFTRIEWHWVVGKNQSFGVCTNLNLVTNSHPLSRCNASLFQISFNRLVRLIYHICYIFSFLLFLLKIFNFFQFSGVFFSIARHRKKIQIIQSPRNGWWTWNWNLQIIYRSRQTQEIFFCFCHIFPHVC